MNNEYEAISSVMLGHAVADALGVPVEFNSRESLKTSPVLNMRGFGTHDMPAGTFSDDTSMSIAALDAIKGGELDYLAVMRNFSDWCFSAKYTATGETFDIGGTCYRAISDFVSSGAVSAFGHGETGEFSCGNGGLMRIHPFSLYAYYTTDDIVERLKIIHDATALTHAHPRCIVGSGIYSIILWELLDGGGKEAITRGAEQALGIYSKKSKLFPSSIVNETEHFIRIFEALSIEDGAFEIQESEIRSTGYVVDTLEAALWSVMTTKDYRSAVLRAVNLGSDTDTVGAVTGGIAGALYGSGGIPREWLSELIGKEHIESMCLEFARNVTRQQP